MLKHASSTENRRSSDALRRRRDLDDLDDPGRRNHRSHLADRAGSRAAGLTVLGPVLAACFRFAPPPAPVAPPLPYVGEIVLPTESWACLARENDVFRVREGGTIGGEYKVESVKADELVLLHLASGVHQTARLASPGGENPGTGPQTVQAPADSAAIAPRGDARSIGPATVSASPSEEPVQRVRPRPHRIRRRA